MAHSSFVRRARTRLLAGVFEHVSASQVETLEILADVDQMTQLMTGLLEAGSGQLVSMTDAFADLQ